MTKQVAEYLHDMCQNLFHCLFFSQFVSSKVACIMEESVVDPEAKTLTTYTRNITFTRLMVVEEKCVYSVHPTNKEW